MGIRVLDNEDGRPGRGKDVGSGSLKNGANTRNESMARVAPQERETYVASEGADGTNLNGIAEAKQENGQDPSENPSPTRSDSRGSSGRRASVGFVFEGMPAGMSTGVNMLTNTTSKLVKAAERHAQKALKNMQQGPKILNKALTYQTNTQISRPTPRQKLPFGETYIM